MNEQYKNAAGSGPASALAFFLIALCGYLMYFTVYLVANASGALLQSVPVVLGIYFPAGLAVFLYFPSDKLTLVISRTAFVAGAACLFSAAACAVALFFMERMTLTDLAKTMAAILICAGAAAAVAVFLRPLFVVHHTEKVPDSHA